MDVLKHGPDNFDRIAVIGSAPDSVALAPFADSSWAIWGCSPGAFAVAASKRSDVWFETHRYHPSQPGKSGAPGTMPYFSPEFHAFLKEYPGPVYMSQAHPEIPHSRRIPFEELLKKYGPYHLTSSIAIMLAMAIDRLITDREKDGREKCIGLWGVDMSATSEYAYQRPGCQHFVGMAAAMGIKIALPPESDLMRHPVVYGLTELNPRHIKWNARLEMFTGKRAQLLQQQQVIAMQLAECNGIIGDIEYNMSSWSDDIDPDPRMAFSLGSEFKGPTAPARSDTPISSGAEVLSLKAG